MEREPTTTYSLRKSAVLSHVVAQLTESLLDANERKKIENLPEHSSREKRTHFQPFQLDCKRMVGKPFYYVKIIHTCAATDLADTSTLTHSKHERNPRTMTVLQQGSHHNLRNEPPHTKPSYRRQVQKNKQGIK